MIGALKYHKFNENAPSWSSNVPKFKPWVENLRFWCKMNQFSWFYEKIMPKTINQRHQIALNAHFKPVLPVSVPISRGITQQQHHFQQFIFDRNTSASPTSLTSTYRKTIITIHHQLSSCAFLMKLAEVADFDGDINGHPVCFYFFSTYTSN